MPPHDAVQPIITEAAHMPKLKLNLDGSVDYFSYRAVSPTR